MRNPPGRLLALFVLPLLAIIPVAAIKPPPCATNDALFMQGLIEGGLVGTVVALVYFIRIPEDRSFGAWLLAAVAVWGLAGVSLAEGINRWADDSAPTVFVARVVDRSARNVDVPPNSKPKYRPIYSAIVMDWRPAGGMRFIEVSKEVYDRLVPNQTLIAAHVKAGALQCEWIERVEVPQ